MKGGAGHGGRCLWASPPRPWATHTDVVRRLVYTARMPKSGPCRVSVRGSLGRAALTLAATWASGCASNPPVNPVALAPESAATAPAAPTLPYETLEQVRYRLLDEQDTDCDQKITIVDQGSRRFRFRLQGQSFDVTGAYALSNLLQELSLARRSGATPRLDRVTEDPVARTSRLIRTEYWNALTRHLDEDGLPAAIEDVKLPGAAQRALYVPADDARSLSYFRKAAQHYDSAYDALVRSTRSLGAAQLTTSELNAMLRTPDGRESLAEVSRRLATALGALDYPGLSRHLMAALSRLGELLEQAGRSCVNGNGPALARSAERAHAILASFAPSKLVVRPLPEPREWPEWSGTLGSLHGVLGLALVDKGGVTSGLPFVVPGGRFNELYGWDSHFIARGLIADERLDLARGLVENQAYMIEHYGAVLNANRTYYLTRSQPPLFAATLRALWDASPRESRDGAWLGRMLHAAIREYDGVWSAPPRQSELCRGEGEQRACLDRYAGIGRGQPPEVEPGHFDGAWQDFGRSLEQSYAQGTLRERDLVTELDTAFEHDRCMRESGHDTTYRWFWADSATPAGTRAANRCADMLTVDLNSLLYRYEVDIAYLLGELARTPAARAAAGLASGGTAAPGAGAWCARAKHRLELMKAVLWSPRDGLFYDAFLGPSGPQQTRYVSATTLYPLWATADACGKAPLAPLSGEERAALVTNALEQLEAPGGLLASAKASRDRFSRRDDRQWDYPNGWAPHQMMAWDGLEAHGFRQDAERLISSWLYLIASHVIDHNGTIPEKYDVVAQTHAVFSEYGNVGTDFDYIATEGFGWMNASFEVGLARLGPDARRRLSQSLAAR
jgi:alpha,alpha-trehalase